MKVRFSLLSFVLMLSSLLALGQQPDTLIKQLDSLTKKTDSAGGQNNSIKQEAYNERTRISFKNYFILLGSNFKQQYTAPFHLQRKDLWKVGRFGLVALGIGLADEPIQHFGLDLRTHNKGVRQISSYVTNTGAQYEGMTLIGIGTYGFLFHNQKLQTTTLLASQAYITSSVLQTILKALSGRQRPSLYNPDKVEAEPTFKGPFHKPFKDAAGQHISSSFPSGHTILAFAAATVYAMEYKDRPLIPILSYSAATLIGLSRITENKHWASDVLIGAGLGYLVGRQVVNNYHRFAKLKAAKQKKNSLSFNLGYGGNSLLADLTYRFN